MTGIRWVGRWRRPAVSPDRLVLLAAVAVRVTASVMVGYGLALVWRHVPHPGWSLLLAVVIVGQNALVFPWWLRSRTLPRGALAADLPFGVVAVLAGAGLARHADPVGWTDFAFPYTVLAAFVLGLACRTVAGAAFAGLTWGLAQLVAGVNLDHQTVLAMVYVVPSYVVNAVVGATSARALRRGTAELDAAWELSVRQAGALATERERARHAWALHDRVLQTLETLAGRVPLADAALRARVMEDAVWLRRFVETGELGQRDDLASGLAAAVRAVTGGGVDIELNDAAVWAEPDPLSGAPLALEALVEATHQALAAVAGPARGRVIVRAAPESGRVLVTILATAGGGAPDPVIVTRVRERLRAAAGDLVVEDGPYLELSVPRADRLPARP
jgi:hypothetical protein